MPQAKPLAAALAAALVLSACGSIDVKPGGHGRGKVDDPRTSKNDHLACIRNAGLPASEIGRTEIQIGAAPAGPLVQFAPSPGTAQGDQIRGNVQGAEVIGSALLYPNQAPDSELQTIENCLSKGVSG
jgi:hypothetical protein